VVKHVFACVERKGIFGLHLLHRFLGPWRVPLPESIDEAETTGPQLGVTRIDRIRAEDRVDGLIICFLFRRTRHSKESPEPERLWARSNTERTFLSRISITVSSGLDTSACEAFGGTVGETGEMGLAEIGIGSGGIGDNALVLRAFLKERHPSL
jgi:hypothetical protein